MSGLSVGFLSQLETGSRSPSADTLRVLATAFDVPLVSLIEADELGDDLPEMIEGMARLTQGDREAVMTLLRALRDKAAR